MRTLTFVALHSLALAISGRAWAQQPEPPSAELRIVAGTSGISASSWVASYTSETCDGGKRLASFSFVTRGKKEARVPVGQRLYLLAAAHVEKPVGADDVGKSSCRGMASFVPEAGKIYEVKHDLETRNCPLLITDASGAPLPTLEKHKVKGPCKKAG